MVKLLVFAILLASTSASALLEKLFSSHSVCYRGCIVNYANSQTHFNACTEGCNNRLHGEDCASQCKAKYSGGEEANCCQIGCTLAPAKEDVTPNEPVIAVDPVPKIEEPVTEASTTSSSVAPEPEPEPDHPRSIILIRLRTRPSVNMPPMENFFGNDPIQMFNDIVRRFQERAQAFENSVRTSVDEQSNNVLHLQPLEQLPQLIQTIPVVRISTKVREDSSSESSEDSSSESSEDSSSESSEESDHGRPLFNEIRHIIKHPREQQQFIRERLEPVNGRFHKTMSNIRDQWKEFVRNQPRMPIWIFIGLLLSSSAILWYMLVSLCRHSPSYAPLSVRAQELVFYPYEYDAYEKEKIQPDGELYDATEPLPIKVKLSNI